VVDVSSGHAKNLVPVPRKMVPESAALGSTIGARGLSYRVSFKTSFDSKQPKLELSETLSETKHLFRFCTETESFDVWIESKQTEDQPKQFEREHIWVFFRKFRVISVCYKTVLFVSVVSI
jgi:hypothetical protein